MVGNRREDHPSLQPPSGPVQNANAKRVPGEAAKIQAKLHAYGFAAALCSKCRGPGVSNCTRSDGCIHCAISYCLACIGYAEFLNLKFPEDFEGEYHREVLRSCQFYASRTTKLRTQMSFSSTEQ